MFEIIVEGVLEGIAMEQGVEDDFNDWVDQLDEDMRDADVWQGPNW